MYIFVYKEPWPCSRVQAVQAVFLLYRIKRKKKKFFKDLEKIPFVFSYFVFRRFHISSLCVSEKSLVIKPAECKLFHTFFAPPLPPPPSPGASIFFWKTSFLRLGQDSSGPLNCRDIDSDIGRNQARLQQKRISGGLGEIGYSGSSITLEDGTGRWRGQLFMFSSLTRC